MEKLTTRETEIKRFFKKGLGLLFVLSFLLPNEILARRAVERGKEIEVLFSEIKENGGFTFDDNTFELLDSTDGGYIVSIFPGRSIRVSGGFTHTNVKSAIKAFMANNYGVLRDPNLFVGAWVDENGDVYLDISKRIAYGEGALDEAKKIGFDNKQIAIYDMGSGVSIDVPSQKYIFVEEVRKAVVIGKKNWKIFLKKIEDKK
jgi:hypothetical protein